MKVQTLKALYAAYKTKQAAEVEHVALVEDAKNAEFYSDEQLAAMSALNSYEFNNYMPANAPLNSLAD